MAGAIQPWPLVRQGDHGHPVRTLQQLLGEWGHAVTVDGDFGPKTDLEVRSLQGALGLVTDGIVGPSSWAKFVVQVRKGSTGDAVRGVQEEFEFRQSGRPGLAIDGIFGPRTDSAVRAFQHALHADVPSVAVDGIVGPVTWRALVSAMLAG